jgi:hypothetical protein
VEITPKPARLGDRLAGDIGEVWFLVFFLVLEKSVYFFSRGKGERSCFLLPLPRGKLRMKCNQEKKKEEEEEKNVLHRPS